MPSSPLAFALFAGLATSFLAQALRPTPPQTVRTLRYAGVELRRTPRTLPAWPRRFALALATGLPTAPREALRAKLRAAGLVDAALLPLYLLSQAGLTAGGLGLAHALGGAHPWEQLAALGCAGLLAPPAWLSLRTRKRQAAIDAVLPDSLDLLVACAEAGLGLDASLAHLVRRSSPACRIFNDELRRYMHDVQAGLPRREALKALGGRAGVPELQNVVDALLQAEGLGASVTQVLRAQAAHLRLARKRRAEERALKAPIKILFPLAFGIFPALFVVLLGPAALRVWDALGH